MNMTLKARTALTLLLTASCFAVGCGDIPSADIEPTSIDESSSLNVISDDALLAAALERASVAASTPVVPSGQAATLAAAPIELIGTGRVLGNATDGLTLTPATLEDGTPHNQLGAFGSSIAYTGWGTRYLAAPDRGPADGTTSYLDRFYTFDIAVVPGAATPVTVTLTSARLLSNRDGNDFVGLATAFDATNSPASLRLDPEGVRPSGRGTFFASDEYGPFLSEFDAMGRRVRTFSLPAKFLIDHPGGTADAELPPINVKGRQPNRGMESLAITPKGDKLYGMMQNALIQDGALDAANKRVGMNNRIIEIDVARGTTREFVYPLDSAKYGVNEILAVNDHQFLVIERDGTVGVDAVAKKIVLVDTTGATDVSAVDALPMTGLPAGVVAVTKTPFLDLLAPEFALAGAAFPEKIEGITFGPDLADGRRLLLVTSDNDLAPAADSLIFAFAIDPSKLPDFRRPVIAPAIDVRPGSAVNVIVRRGSGQVPVAILSNGLFDATTVDPSSVTLAGAPVTTRFGRPLCTKEDANRDGRGDLVCSVAARSMNIGTSSRTAILEARTSSGSPVVGQDAILVLP